MSRWSRFVPVLGLVALLGACSGGAAGSRGAPEAVIRAAPERTLAAASARVEAAAPDASSVGVVRFPGPGAELQPSGPGASKGYPELRDPLAVVDLVRGALEVVSYGGTAVREASTFRYETVIDVEAAVRATPEGRKAAVQAMADRLGVRAFYADVWVDTEGRIRRVQMPVEKTVKRPGNRDRTRPPLITVDFFAFDA
ncbi:MAG: hypothetical protein M3N28_08205 [Actinomycetota bacterium]|nr:hypothetical protein [Actinomycetota bacterium]